MGTPKRKKKQTPETQFHSSLTFCSKNKDLNSAISLYESAVSQNTRLNQHHFNTLLYLCSNSVTDPSLKQLALEYGFRVFDHMSSIEVLPNEATITAVARLAAAKGDGDYAFELVKGMEKYNVLPRLRTCDPALFGFCEKLEADKAYEVEEYMNKVGVSVEEPEIAALLKVSAETGRGERVYDYLHKLRNAVRCVHESTAKIIEDWYRDGRASEVGEVNWDSGRVKEAVLRNGGGWHGQGWVGKGDWSVQRANVDSDSRCCSCGEHLVCVDIDCAETDRFAQSVAALAMEREVKLNFSEFQDWLDKHADYEAIVDGANIGLYQQNFAEGGFSLPQLDAVVKELYNRSGEKWPLVVLHNRRFRSLVENPSHRKVVEEWMDKGILYTTPSGSNDDWYWLYAAVKLKCLLVTNDEMRDHIFELLGSSFFLKWKERHQVRYTFVKGNLKLQTPPPYSSVIQESESGSWHVPVADDSDEEPARTWLCITRPSASKASTGALLSQNAFLNSCTSEFVTSHNDKTTTKTGKRKERSPSPSHLMT
ncbi:putative ribonuclease P [Rosa chinensis]|uniref:ribonuclease P n=1 Tax=Rosa chinensis TaxID=74649 RepID=A0A2P6QDG6_ROSCH|nr:proteinaceous RNase P 2 [Rosa chinensis]XP_024199714.1 proteinaceous RNase P 2 [Rosa chinensis]XP_024199715.1 proteinaceous RNase P 2 [Rosa chinensis]XP_024199716.1 proteinaceous RNase P 2 [Rosa chinensis]XP_040362124.1 proteinaceous RNase P 2 [Rosa chinensis]PRQ32222.1 putative ribonuclease P [Rosa chinensis]